MTRLQHLIALCDAVKEGRLYDAVSIVKVMQSSAHDRGDIEIMSRSTVEKIMLRKSTDAALAFHEAVLPGALVSSMDQDSRRRWYVTLTDIRGQFLAHDGASHPAVALFLADMAALIAIEEGKG